MRRELTQEELNQQIAVAVNFLGIDMNEVFNSAIINAAYKRLARTVHPDVCRGPESVRLMKLAVDCRDLLLKLAKPQQPRVNVQRGPGPGVTVTWYHNHNPSWTGGSSGF